LTRSLQLENSCLVYNYRACLLKDMGNLDGALEDFNAALNLDNTHPIAICNRGRTYSELGKCREALKDLNKAFAIHADDRKKIMEINALIEKTRIQCAHKSIFRPW
jgi:lipoprotein NlpI